MSVELAGNGDLPAAIGPRWWCGRVVMRIAPLSFHPLLRFPFRWLPLVLGSLRWLCIVVGFLFDVVVGFLFDVVVGLLLDYLAVHNG